MAKGKIKMKVRRSLGYSTLGDRIRYIAIVRVYLQSARGPAKDLAIVRVYADSPQTLNSKIRKLKAQFLKLQKESPEFVKSIGESEIIPVDFEE